MAQQTINVGSAINDGTGDPARTAFTKCNANFTELYAAGGGAATPPQGRLTLQTATPVMTSTQSAKTTLFYSPYVGNQVLLYDGTSMVPTTFTELSVATTDTTKSPAAIGASKVNDWFIWSDAGTIRIGHGPDWTSDTVRSAGTALVMVNGILLNNAAITNGPAASRGTYVGTTRSNASSQLDWILGAAAASGGTAGFLGVWNCYNRVSVGTMTRNTDAGWSYNGGIRSAGTFTSTRISAVFGLAEDAVDVSYTISLSPGAGINGISGIGVDSTTAYDGIWVHVAGAVGADVSATASPSPYLGFHFFQALESTSGGAVSFNPNNSGISQAGIYFKGKM